MVYRRGFKSQCERRSIEFRRQLGAPPTGALQADDLAHALSVTVWSTNEIADLESADLELLNDNKDGSWSTLTMRTGTANLVVYKPVNSEGRRNSVIMHELSHIVLGHELAEACILDDGSLVPDNFCQDQEDEADWLAGTLLLPRPALVSIRQRQLSDSDACDQYFVSKDMLNWRIRMTGVDYQMARRRARR